MSCLQAWTAYLNGGVNALKGGLKGANVRHQIVRIYGDNGKMGELASMIIVIDPQMFGNTLLS